MTGYFAGVLQVEFGDWGPDVGRMARTLAPITWNSGEITVIIPAGTISDGATVPRLLWWFLPPWGDEATIPAVLHDYLCEQLDNGVPVPGCEKRFDCDWQFYLALLARRVARWRARLAWAGVRINSLLTRYGQ